MDSVLANSGLAVRKALPQDADAVLDILQEGIAAIRELGIGQWQNGYPNHAAVEADIAARQSWVCEDTATGELLGTLALVFDYEEDYASPTEHWLTAENRDDVPYAVIHRTAVRRSAARRGVMSALFAHAEEQARAAERLSIRVDTHPGNVRMRNFCVRAGYTLCGEHELTPNGDETELVRLGYEKLL